MATKYMNFTSATTLPSTAGFPVRGRTHVHASGTWGSGTLTMEMLLGDGTTWAQLADASWTADVDDVFDFPDQVDTYIRFVMTGGAGHNLDVDARSHS